MGRAAIDITGQRFTKLTAKFCIGTDPRARDRIWYCECDCGGGVSASVGALRSGNTKSCGCLRRRRAEPVSAAAAEGAGARRRRGRPPKHRDETSPVREMSLDDILAHRWGADRARDREIVKFMTDEIILLRVLLMKSDTPLPVQDGTGCVYKDLEITCCDAACRICPKAAQG